MNHPHRPSQPQPRAQHNESPTPYRVTVFRRTIARGWERFEVPPHANCSALPKKECIEIRALKLRISLKKVKCMVQRGDSLLLTIEQQSGGDVSAVLVMLKFDHYGECASFCDAIVSLNLTGWTRGDEDTTAGASSSSSTSRSDALSYIVRLLHDRDFNEFVDDIESLLRSSPDCAGIVAALGEKRAPPFAVEGFESTRL
uniref:Uncharacterized protein n=2 Tax=Leptocylindrus danicus TaxID=163516 RepID=A0A7S2LE56_9STRA|mmetsp:Transcript_4503/g.6574  ORF Transcript_4503/g.6574 Transcript_4503/m.6574 type:complete len:200 (+) Transcript_4503:18-617(+)